MSLDVNFTFPEKENGLYGNLDYTWDFDIHWPKPTLEYIEDLTGYSLESLKGTTEAALIEVNKVARLSKIEFLKRIPKQSQFIAEYFIAHDEDRIYDALEFQIHIFEAGFNDGGWLSMYETTDEYGLKSTIGQAAEDYIDYSLIGIKYYDYDLDPDLIRVDY